MNSNVPKKQPSLKALSVRSTLWTMTGHGSNEFLRLLSNLVLTRILIPEDFGLMLLVNVFLMGLQLFSDVGIGPSIIQNKRGEEKSFLNTAWTIQVGRGFFLWFIAILAAQPFANFYEQPQLAQILPIAGVAAVIGGFNCTSLFSLNRKLHLGKVTLLAIAQQIVGITVMIVWATIHPTVWALVAGNLTNVLVRAVASHFLIKGHRNRFHWDREASRSLFRFGKWIFLSTAFGFFATRGDHLILGKLISVEELGYFSIATALAAGVITLLTTIGRRVLFPVYARLAERSSEELTKNLVRIRLNLLCMALPPLCLLSIFGDHIVNFLWDPRYEPAGPMLQILSAGGVVRVINTTSIPVLLAVGDSFRHLINTITRSLFLALAMFVGAHYGGTMGCIAGIAVAPILQYPVLSFTIYRYGAWHPALDLGAALLAGTLIFAGLNFF